MSFHLTSPGPGPPLVKGPIVGFLASYLPNRPIPHPVRTRFQRWKRKDQMQPTGDRDARPGICTGWSYIKLLQAHLDRRCRHQIRGTARLAPKQCDGQYEQCYRAATLNGRLTCVLWMILIAS